MTTDALASRFGTNFFNTPNTTEFGVLSNQRDIPIRLTAATNLTVSYVRESLQLQAWKGYSYNVDMWLDSGFTVILNINNDSTPSPFPTDMVSYENNLRSVLDVYQPELVVIENEELNSFDSANSSTLYHTGSLADYITELSVAVRVCKEKNLQVTNGGLTNPIVSSLYNYYTVNNKTDSAQWLYSK